jgi:hypothetical protein
LSLRVVKGDKLEPNERLELKILALKEELGSRDDRIADLRVMNHEIAQQLQGQQEELESLREEKRVRDQENVEAKPEDSDSSD